MAAEEGRHNEAIDHWRRATALDPDEFEKLLAIAISIARSGRPADAVPYFQLFADSAPSPRYAADVAKARDWLRQQRATRD
jgi:tetratricopeptide (TPR) repeat protein